MAEDQTMSIDYLAKVRQFHRENIEPYLGLPRGCTPQSVAYLERVLGFALPAAYVQYLLWMGQDYHGIFQGSDCFITHLAANRGCLSELLQENNVTFSLPDGYLVYFTHQGYIAAWFVLPKEDEDPLVWSYSEGRTVPLPCVEGIFSELLLDDMQGLSRALARVRGSDPAG